MFNKLYLLALVFVMYVGAVGASAVYKTVHQDGSITYSDMPSEGAELVPVPQVNSAVMPSLATDAFVENKRTGAKKGANPHQIARVSILSPEHEETVRNNAGKVTVVVQASEENKDQKFQLRLNGRLRPPQTATTFKVEDLDRGIYTIQVELIDKMGKVLALSEEQTFYLHKASALINAR